MKKPQTTHLVQFFCAAALSIAVAACDEPLAPQGDYDYNPDPKTVTLKQRRITPTVDMAKASLFTNVDFSMYAFRSANYANTKTPNYASPTDQIVDIQGTEVNIKSDNTLAFKDKVKRYFSSNNPDYRYNFFAYYLDGATTYGGVKMNGATAQQEIEVDGTSDVVMGVSYHSEAKLNKCIRNEMTKGYSSDYTMRMLSNYRHGLLYSTVAAKHDIQPIVHLKRLFARFSIKVKGRDASEGHYKGMIITGIEFIAPNHGILTIANDAWTSEESFTKALSDNMIFKPTTGAKPITMPLKAQDRSRDASFNSYKNAIQSVYGVTSDPDGWYHVTSTTSTAIVPQTMYMPVADSYQIRLHYYYVDPKNKSSVLDMTNSDAMTTYTVATSGEFKFEADKTYKLTIDINEPGDIKILVTK